MNFTWKDVPDMWKWGTAIVAVTVFVMTYHDQFITEAEAMEAQQPLVDEVRLLRVLRYEDKLERLIDDKAKATEAGDAAKRDKLEEQITTLRNKIESTCETIKEGCL